MEESEEQELLVTIDLGIQSGFSEDGSIFSGKVALSVPAETARRWEQIRLFDDSSEIQERIKERLSVRETAHGIQPLFDGEPFEVEVSRSECRPEEWAEIEDTKAYVNSGRAEDGSESRIFHATFPCPAEAEPDMEYPEGILGAPFFTLGDHPLIFQIAGVTVQER